MSRSPLLQDSVLISPVPSSMRSSVIWSAIRNWGPRLGSVVVFFVLARLLEKSQLGLVATAITITALVELFAENGIGDAVVQRKDVDRQLLSTALWLNIFFSLVVCVILWIAAPFIETYLALPGLAVVLAPVALSIIFNAISYVPQASLRREFKFQWLGIRALVSTFVSGAVGIAMAVLGFGVWSMIAQFLLAAFLNAVMVWVGAGWRPQLVFDKKAALSITQFSYKVLGGRLLSFLASRSIEIIIVAQLSAAMLSTYIMGSRISAVMMQMLSAVAIDVSLASFSRLAHEPEKLHAAFYDTSRFAAAIMVPAFLMVSALSPELTKLAFGWNSGGTDGVLSMTAIQGAVEVLQFLCGTLIVAAGRPGMATMILAAKAIAIVIVLNAFSYVDAQGMVNAYVLTILCIAPVSFICARLSAGISLLAWLRVCWPFILSAIIMFAVLHYARPLFESQVTSVPVRFIVMGMFGGIVYMGCAAAFDFRGLKKILVSLLK